MATRREGTVATVDNSGITVHTERFAKVLPDDTVVEAVTVEKAGAQWNLLISGRGASGEGVTYHFPVEFAPDGAIQLARRRVRGRAKGDDENGKNGEDGGRCVGNHCQRCKWTGLCSCTAGSGECNHETGAPFAPDEIFLKR